MKRKLGILITVTLVTIFCTGLAVAAAADQPIKWKMVSTWTPAINLIEGDKNFAKLVGELSNGRLQITH